MTAAAPAPAPTDTSRVAYTKRTVGEKLDRSPGAITKMVARGTWPPPDLLAGFTPLWSQAQFERSMEMLRLAGASAKKDHRKGRFQPGQPGRRGPRDSRPADVVDIEALTTPGEMRTAGKA
jgi:hypothetical protein